MLALNPHVRKVLTLWPVYLALLLFGIWFYLNFVAVAPKILVNCDFVLRTGNAPLRSSSRNLTITNLRVQGQSKETTQASLLSFDGSVSSPDAKRFAPISGNIFLARDGTVEGLFLVEGLYRYDPRSAQDQLRITTLNREGILDMDRSTAFLFFDPSEKRSHPANYICKITKN